MYFNACSIVPKFGELCPIVETINQPDIVSIVESWLCEDHEISTYWHMPGNNPFCRDRSGHNG